MAFGIHICAKIHPNDKENVIIEPSWWNYREIWKEHNFVQTGNYAYTDYIWNLDKTEFINLLKSQEKYLNQGIYAHEQWIKNNDATMNQINNLLEQIDRDSDLKIRIFEWDY